MIEYPIYVIKENIIQSSSISSRIIGVIEDSIDSGHAVRFKHFDDTILYSLVVIEMDRVY